LNLCSLWWSNVFKQPTKIKTQFLRL
jgi:hypothetical protein